MVCNVLFVSLPVVSDAMECDWRLDIYLKVLFFQYLFVSCVTISFAWFHHCFVMLTLLRVLALWCLICGFFVVVLFVLFCCLKIGWCTFCSSQKITVCMNVLEFPACLRYINRVACPEIARGFHTPAEEEILKGVFTRKWYFKCFHTLFKSCKGLTSVH